MINSYYPQDPIVGSITIQGNDWITVDKSIYDINDLKNRIEKLEEGFRKIELKNRSKSGEVYDLMERVRQLNSL